MKISIIIPAYNSENYIERCLDSVLSQEGAELDVIVINDGSADSTGEILEKYKDRVNVVSMEKNSGVSAARNKGLSLIKGDFVMFLDADDYLSEDAVIVLKETLEKTGADIVKFRCRLVYPDGRIKRRYNQFENYDIIEKKDFKTKIYPYFISGIRLNNLCTGIYRSSLVKDGTFREDMKVAEDVVFSLDVYTKAQKAVLIPDILYNYYQTGEGLTGKGAKVMQKYKCNYIFAAETAKYLKEWDMDNLPTRIRVYLRPVLLTFDKAWRIIVSRK